jgi:hypothetical protein
MFQNGIQDGLVTLQQCATGRAIGSESGHGVCLHALVKRPHPCQQTRAWRPLVLPDCPKRMQETMSPADIVKAITSRLPGVVPKPSWGDTALFFNPGGQATEWRLLLHCQGP